MSLCGLAVDHVDGKTQCAQFGMAAQLVGSRRRFRLLVFNEAEITGHEFLVLWWNRFQQNVIGHPVSAWADKLQQQVARRLVVLAVSALDGGFTGHTGFSAW